MTQTPTNRQTQIGLFFQDTYHATPKLVLDLGIRYDYLEAVKPKGKGGRQTTTQPTTVLMWPAMAADPSIWQTGWAPRI